MTLEGKDMTSTTVLQQNGGPINPPPPNYYGTMPPAQPGGSGYYPQQAPVYTYPTYQRSSVTNLNDCCMPVPSSNGDEEENEAFKASPHVKIDFDSTFSEPKNSQSFGFAYTYNKVIYERSMRFFYATLAMLLGPILAFTFGITMALLNFVFIWLATPTIKIIHVCLRVVDLLVRPMVQVFLDPVFRAMGSVYLARNAGPFTPRTYNVTVNGSAASESVVRGIGHALTSETMMDE